MLGNLVPSLLFLVYAMDQRFSLLDLYWIIWLIVYQSLMYLLFIYSLV